MEILVLAICAFAIIGFISALDIITNWCKMLINKRKEKHKGDYKNLVLYNANPDNKRVGDCAIRAMSKVLDISWEQAFIDLSKLAFEQHTVECDTNIIRTVMKFKYGFDEIKGYGGTVKEFVEENPKGTYAILVNNHMVAVSKGKLYDTFDSSEYAVNYVYAKKAQT